MRSSGVYYPKGNMPDLPHQIQAALFSQGEFQFQEIPFG
ncbi:hypothetical protein Acaty_c0248 [Acidithiobacillus caldus ATCC 51756]|uniref:Uncharacterized protein n=1 Tax=Acidithiobacillus caldus (strain ATCC 51756 / DSM 8584 / KU) TaxID=637389 RepID=A0A059ZM50_ACICK|nr:hypothetical protein Acaty_c0248 [Acidithiobacillus caldus ATCC 51756]